VKTTIKGKGCTAEACAAPRAPCCKLADPNAKPATDAKAAPEAPASKPPSLSQTHDYDIQNPTLKFVDAPSPVKTTIKGEGCTAEACPAPRAPCCKLADPNAKPEAPKAPESKPPSFG
jgi:hypothetical protein